MEVSAKLHNIIIMCGDIYWRGQWCVFYQSH